MIAIDARPTQTKVKHTILEKYLNIWGGIIINGIRSHPKDLHFVYIDCNASYGRFNGEIEDAIAKRDIQPVWGSPIIGIKMLDHHTAWARENVGITLRTTSILFENNAKTFEELKRSLDMAGLAHRVRETDDFFALKDGEIAIHCGDSTSMAAQLVQYTQSGLKFCFFVLDPYGPKGIPLNYVHEIIRQPRHDSLIYMPYLDLQKKSGLVPKQNRSSIDKKLLHNYNVMFGNDEWQNIVRALDTDEIRLEQTTLQMNNLQTNEAIQVGDLELKLMNCYKQSLLSADPDLVVKSIDLHFPDRDRTIYYLYLTTHDPTGALQMNKVLSEAGYQEYILRWNFMQAKKLGGQLTLFDTPAPPLSTLPRASKEEIGKHILRLLGGQSIIKRKIYAKLADEPYFANEIDNALKLLRKQKKISFEGELRHKTLIEIARA